MIRLYPRSLRARLTLWYSTVLVLVALILAGASRWALSVSLDHALDQGLRHRLIGLHEFIDENSGAGLEALARTLRELDKLGELIQVFGPNGELMAQSNGLARHHVSTQVPPDPGAGMRFRNAGPPWFPVRMASQRIYVDQHPLIIEVADPQAKFQGVLGEFYSVLYVAVPLALITAAFGGYWLSGRALAPVDQIVREAHSLEPGNLAARLSVPRSGEEMRRLSETLNEMLGRVEQSVLQVQQFTADASHELRAPMTLIHTAAEFALRRDRGAAELKEALRKILREAQRCTQLINELLTLARSDAGSSGVSRATVDMNALLGEVADEASLLASNKGLSVSTRLPETAVHAAVDESSFRRLLLILLDNAVKYTPVGGTVAVGMVEDTTGVSIAVSDTGPGIAADQLPFIFDRFWRADKVRSREAGGNGLGLAIAREIVQSHGAEITVESLVDHGSTFTVRIPHTGGKRSPVESVSEQAVL